MALNVAKEVAALERMSVNDLCERYRETFGEETNARNKRWLVKRIAWKLQANAEGDISERARRLATKIALSTDIRSSFPKTRRRPTVETLTTASTIISPPADCRLPVPGTTLLKTYKGRDVQVRVLPNSFEFEGEQYKTLTSIAHIVTGQPNINGYQFFKLGRRPEAVGRREKK